MTLQATRDRQHEAWCRQQWQMVPRAGRTPNSYPPRLPIHAPLIELTTMHKVILMVLAGYPSSEAYKRAEIEEELRRRENTIAAELQRHPDIMAAMEAAGDDDSARVEAVYQLAGLNNREIGALERSFQGLSAKQIALEMSNNKDRPEVPVRTAEDWIRRARSKLRRLGEER